MVAAVAFSTETEMLKGMGVGDVWVCIRDEFVELMGGERPLAGEVLEQKVVWEMRELIGEWEVSIDVTTTCTVVQ